MQFLISAEWIEQEADKRGVEVTRRRGPEAVRGPEEAGRSRTTRQLPAVPQDLRHDRGGPALPREARTSSSSKLTQKVTKDANARSPTRTSRTYYDKNKKRFAQPERRDLRVVLTKTKAKADAGQEGSSRRASASRQVAKKYSIDEASKSQGGLLPAVSEGQQEKAFRHRDLPRRPEEQDPGPREDPSSAGTSSRWKKVTTGLAADARGVEGHTSRTCCAPSASRSRSTTFVKQVPRGPTRTQTELRGRLPQ